MVSTLPEGCHETTADAKLKVEKQETNIFQRG
jgi:hypothetical protein